MKFTLIVEDNDDGTCDIEIIADPPVAFGKPIETQAENIAYRICNLLADMCEGVEEFNIEKAEQIDGRQYH